MTFSLVGMCHRTGMFGAAVTTSNMNVGTRCPFAKASIGAVLTQHRTDNRLGPKGLELLEEGKTAPEVIDSLASDNPTMGWRQLAVIDQSGNSAFYHGDRIASTHAAAQGASSCAIGNIIRTEAVPQAMIDAFEEAPSFHLAERLRQFFQLGLLVLPRGNNLRRLAVHFGGEPFSFLRVRDFHPPEAAKQSAQLVLPARFCWEFLPDRAEFGRRSPVSPWG